jgi:hypothetical protein
VTAGGARALRLACALVAAIALLGPGTDASAQSRRGLTEVLANPSAFDNEEIYVEGVVVASQWSPMTVLGNPPRQDLFPLLLLTDGAASMWVIIVASPAPRIGSRSAFFTPPSVGTAILVRGTFRAATRALESYDGFTQR